MSFDVSELDTTERAMYDAINTIVEGTKEDVARMESNLDVLWLLFGAYLVFSCRCASQNSVMPTAGIIYSASFGIRSAVLRSSKQGRFARRTRKTFF